MEGYDLWNDEPVALGRRSFAIVAIVGCIRNGEYADDRILVARLPGQNHTARCPARVLIRARAVHDFQDAAEFSTDSSIPVQPGKGWLLELSEIEE